MFDPDKVERLGHNWAEEVVPVGSESDVDAEFVRASDYDALLALYRRRGTRPPFFIFTG